MAKKAKVARARHRRQPRLRDGRAADRADRRLRARRSHRRATAIQDARIRRLPFQQKIGAGLTTEQFQKKVDDGSVRHVGLTESIAMIADALGWTLDRITDDIQPKLAAVTISSEYLAVDPGYVCGIIQDGVGYRKNEPVIKLHMEAYLGSPETYDSVDDRRVAEPVDEDLRRHPRRRRDRVDRRQLDSEGAAARRPACTRCAISPLPSFFPAAERLCLGPDAQAVSRLDGVQRAGEPNRRPPV